MSSLLAVLAAHSRKQQAKEQEGSYRISGPRHYILILTYLSFLVLKHLTVSPNSSVIVVLNLFGCFLVSTHVISYSTANS